MMKCIRMQSPSVRTIMQPLPLTTVFCLPQCSRIESQRVFLQQVMTGEDKVAVIGCGCSMATESVAQISGFWNITHVCIQI
jgi:hypothetical protein